LSTNELFYNTTFKNHKLGYEAIKMNNLYLISMAWLIISLAGCSKTDNYTPPSTMSGEEIFNLNCTKCHKPEIDAVIRLSANRSNQEAILKKIHSGGMTMPAFPNIKGESAKRLTKYILENSKPK